MKKYKIGYTTGAFDPFHHGHLNILKRAKEMTEFLIVGVSTDELIEKVKNRKRYMALSDRINIISELKCIDKVIPQIDKNKQAVIDKYNIDVVFVGSDWKGKYPKVSCDIVYFDYTDGISSTLIRGE